MYIITIDKEGKVCCDRGDYTPVSWWDCVACL